MLSASDIEGTHSQAVRALGLRRTRHFGLPKTAVSHIFTATAINLIRLDAFLKGKKVAKARVSRFAALALVIWLAKGFANGVNSGMTHAGPDENLAKFSLL